MNFRKLAFAAGFFLLLGSTLAHAQQDAGTQLNDADDTGSYATQGSQDGEDASDAAGAVFDGTSGGTVQDPGTLEPHPLSAEPNEDE